MSVESNTEKQFYNYSGDTSLIDLRKVKPPFRFTKEAIINFRAEQELARPKQKPDLAQTVVPTATEEQHNYSGDPVWVNLSTIAGPISK